MDGFGYHGTCSEYRQSIEKNGLDPDKTKYRDDHWLGQGVYFFVDYDQALWWAKTISSKKNNCGAIIFRSNIVAPVQNVLNLDDNKQLDAFLNEVMSYIQNAEKECIGEMPIFEQKNIRSVLFDYYKQKNDIFVIIGTFQKEFAGYTTRRNPKEKKIQKRILDIIDIRFNEKQICVSKKECINSTKLVYEEQKEVE